MAIKDHIVDLTDKIKKDLSFNKETSSVEDSGSFESNIPEGLTMETIVAVNKYETDYVAASTNAFGQVCIEQFKKDKDLDIVTGNFKMAGNNEITHEAHREAVKPNPANRDQPVTKYCDIRSTYKLTATHQSTGQLKQVRVALNEEAAKLLG